MAKSHINWKELSFSEKLDYVEGYFTDYYCCDCGRLMTYLQHRLYEDKCFRCFKKTPEYQSRKLRQKRVK